MIRGSERVRKSRTSSAGFVREVEAALAWAKTHAETTPRLGIFSGSYAERKSRIYNGLNVADGLGTLTKIGRRRGDHYGNDTGLRKSRRTAVELHHGAKPTHFRVNFTALLSRRRGELRDA